MEPPSSKDWKNKEMYINKSKRRKNRERECNVIPCEALFARADKAIKKEKRMRMKGEKRERMRE